MLDDTKNALRSVAPRFLKDFLRGRKIARLRARNAGRSVRELFEEIYSANKWGGLEGALCSGSGSTDEHARPYATAVGRFIAEQGIRHVVDLGCGDFTVGARLLAAGLAELRYTGIDVVAEVIRRNTEKFGSDQVAFECRDIVEDQLPQGELCLVRQVFQHLSNGQILRVLPKLRQYPSILVTEHYPAISVRSTPNVDKPCGEDTRVLDHSGVYLDSPPFNFGSPQLLLDVPAQHCVVGPGERLRTFLFRNS